MAPGSAVTRLLARGHRCGRAQAQGPTRIPVGNPLGDLKTTLTVGYHSLKSRKYAANDLAAITNRFNRRFDLHGMISRLIVDVARCARAKERVVMQQAEAGSEAGSQAGSMMAAAAIGSAVSRALTAAR